MGRYRRRSRPLYNIRHLLSLNVNFRASWENGLRKALSRVEELKSQGWNVDTQRGALTEKQADFYVQAAEKMGYETTRVPVAMWVEDKVQFVAYKPKTPVTEEAKIPPPHPQSETKPRTLTRKDTLNPLEEFQKMFWKKKQPGPDDVDDGFLMSPDRTMAVIRKDASPHSVWRNIANLVAETVQNPEVVEELDYNKLVKAEKISKTVNPHTRSKWTKYVSFNGNVYGIDKIKQALRVLGARKQGKAYVKSGNFPLVVQNPAGDSVLIASAVIEPIDPRIVSISTVNAL
jgi:hypothetical protein